MASSGFFNLNKPVGPSSSQIVVRLKRLAGVRKIGHSGTLDPLASGVLPICVGRAVRLSEYLSADDKVYEAEVTFGIRTTTDDVQGEVVSRQGVQLSKAEVESALGAFLGEQEQLPPQYSAIKIAGEPMYKLARRGQHVEARARPIHIYALVLLDWSSPQARLEIRCSKGTYIRALARDLGSRLGCGGHLSALVRKTSGMFELSTAVTPERLEQARDWREYLLPMDWPLANWPAVHLDGDDEQRVLRGQPVACKPHFGLRTEGGRLVRAYGRTGDFIAVMVHDPTGRSLRPEKVLSDRH